MQQYQLSEATRKAINLRVEETLRLLKVASQNLVDSQGIHEVMQKNMLLLLKHYNLSSEIVILILIDHKITLKVINYLLM